MALIVTGTNYIGWVPTTFTLRRPPTDAAGHTVTVRNMSGTVGQLVFASPPGAAVDQLHLNVPGSTDVPFTVAGIFGSPSADDQDAGLEVVDTNTGAILAQTRLMVRVRKNATDLTPGERERFLAALAQLNSQGHGLFAAFRLWHQNSTFDEAHSFDGFLPWHRAYLLHLERDLQAIDPGVSLPYWRFDQPAPSLFQTDFLGSSDPWGNVTFDADNPLLLWTTDGVIGVNRSLHFNPTATPDVIGETATLALGGQEPSYAAFVRMEGSPHGNAHTSFGGFLSSPHTAVRDPLFFLLHCNVDRLWAKWQWIYNRANMAIPGTYSFLGGADQPGSTRIGHNANDTMWPWNGSTIPPRPTVHPGNHSFPLSSTAQGPGAQITVRSMIDYQGRIAAAAHLGFDYDDVPYQ